MYRFIRDNKHIFGLNWLFKRCGIFPNGYYNYLKDRKHSYRNEKQEIYQKITEIYHLYGGVPGYRMMRSFLERDSISLSSATVHQYMNKDLGLFSIVRKKKPAYRKGDSHPVFSNLLSQDFHADEPNQKWCTDFTYIPLTNGTMRYNCSVLDLHERAVVASVTGKNINAELAVNAVSKALSSQPRLAGKKLILHSDQGAQFTSKEFTEFCKANHITQSMSRAGCPYDNAPMERYFNTLKNELIYHHYFHTDEELDKAIADFAYLWYNHLRPHTFNNGMTPFEKRFLA